MSDGEVIEFFRGLTALEARVLWSITAEMFDAINNHDDWGGTTLAVIAFRANTDVPSAARAIRRLEVLGMLEITPSKLSPCGTRWRLIFPRDVYGELRNPSVDCFDITLEEIAA